MWHIHSFVFGPFQENTYLLYTDERECVIIDPGCYYEDEKSQLLGYINEHTLTPRILLNTHCHLDHVFGNKMVADQFGLTLHLHPKEETVLSMAPASGLMFNLPFDNYQGVFKFLKAGDWVEISGDRLEVIEAPGHSPGSICLYSAAQQFLIGGDVLFNRSIGRTDLPGGNHETLLHSIRERLFVLPDDTVVYSGHGEKTTLGEEKRFNPFLQ